jgi:hypothetical protein
MADSFPVNPGSIVTMDRGYSDYALFGRWTERKIFFVIRPKDNARCEVIEGAAVPAKRNILSDDLIQFTGDQAREGLPLSAEARGCVGRRREPGNRAVFQSAEAEPQGEELRGHQPRNSV